MVRPGAAGSLPDGSEAVLEALRQLQEGYADACRGVQQLQVRSLCTYRPPSPSASARPAVHQRSPPKAYCHHCVP